MRKMYAGEGAGAEVIRAMGYSERPRSAKFLARMGPDSGGQGYRIRMFADTIPNRWRRSGLVVVAAAAAAVVGHLD